jgi:hypothetical protein
VQEILEADIFFGKIKTFFYNLGVTGLDFCGRGPGGVPGMMVGLVKIHHTINANDNYDVVAEAEAILAGAEAPALV